MISFEVTLDPDNWTEILNGGFYIAFDITAAQPVEIYFTETADDPGAAVGTKVTSHPAGWDYQGMGFERGEQRIWVKGRNIIRGVRV